MGRRHNTGGLDGLWFLVKLPTTTEKSLAEEAGKWKPKFQNGACCHPVTRVFRLSLTNICFATVQQGWRNCWVTPCRQLFVNIYMSGEWSCHHQRIEPSVFRWAGNAGWLKLILDKMAPDDLSQFWTRLRLMTKVNSGQDDAWWLKLSAQNGGRWGFDRVAQGQVLKIFGHRGHNQRFAGILSIPKQLSLQELRFLCKVAILLPADCVLNTVLLCECLLISLCVLPVFPIPRRCFPNQGSKLRPRHFHFIMAPNCGSHLLTPLICVRAERRPDYFPSVCVCL
jgi:hypothetical protein